MAGVLREEREHEIRRRAAEAGTLETQPDLGLGEPVEDEQARRAREARDHMARMRGDEEAAKTGRVAAEAAAAAAGSRRELLPNVDEINQTLRATGEPRVVDQVDRREPMEPLRPRGGGFRRGFFIVLLLAVIAVALYAYAARIALTVPQAAPVLEVYVAQVDAARIWLDKQVTALMLTLDQMSSETAPPEGTTTEGN